MFQIDLNSDFQKKNLTRKVGVGFIILAGNTRILDMPESAETCANVENIPRDV